MSKKSANVYIEQKQVEVDEKQVELDEAANVEGAKKAKKLKKASDKYESIA